MKKALLIVAVLQVILFIFYRGSITDASYRSLNNNVYLTFNYTVETIDYGGSIGSEWQYELRCNRRIINNGDIIRFKDTGTVKLEAIFTESDSIDDVGISNLGICDLNDFTPKDMVDGLYYKLTSKVVEIGGRANKDSYATKLMTVKIKQVAPPDIVKRINYSFIVSTIALWCLSIMAIKRLASKNNSQDTR